MVINKFDKIFYSNGKENIELTYDELLNHIVNIKDIKQNFSFTCTKDFLINFIGSLYYNIDLSLIDLNIRNKNFHSVLIDEKTNLPNNINQLIHGIKNSKSKVKLFTSGTTGQPKQICHSVSNLIREVRIGEKYKNNIWAFAYNPTHMAGIQVLFQAFLNKNSIFDVFEFNKKDIEHTILKNKVTNISATPTFYRLIIPFKKPISSVKNVSLGGEKSNHELHKKIKNSFPNAKILNIYASTEAGTLFSTSGKYFKILPNKSKLVKIINGELVIHKSLLGYFKSKENKKDLWYNTGDLVEIINKKTNEFSFVSRKNEMINVGGNKVNPTKIESIIDNIDDVEKCYIYGKSNSVLGNILCAKVQLKNSNIDKIKLRALLKNKLEIFEIPRKIDFVNKLKLTRTGKLKRNL